MNSYLQTQVKSIHNVKNMVMTKASVAPKLRARELRLSGGKRNRHKGKGYLVLVGLSMSQ
jgi:hypothetical protein